MLQGEGAWEPKANCKNRPFVAPASPQLLLDVGPLGADPEGADMDEEEDRQFASEDDVEEGEEEERWVREQRSRGRGGGGRSAPRRREALPAPIPAPDDDDDDYEEERQQGMKGGRQRGESVRGREPHGNGQAVFHNTSLKAARRQHCSQDFLRGQVEGGVSLAGDEGDGDGAALLAALAAAAALPLSPNSGHRRKGKPQRSRLDGEEATQEMSLAAAAMLLASKVKD